VKKYEIWGVDDGGNEGVLAYATLDQPAIGDTILVRGTTRQIGKVWRHHNGAQATPRVLVHHPAGEAASEDAAR
jgi:hypothetical protein